MTHAFGMDTDDTLRVDSLEVPPGEHIQTFTLHSGWLIDALGFRTNTGKEFGPIGGEGGNHYLKLDHEMQFQHHYIDGIQGKTVKSQGYPCICDLQFKFVIVSSEMLQK